MTKKKATRLTDKQRLFALHYATTLNATEAARLAGYQGSYDVQRAMGSENLTKPHIQTEINRLLEERTVAAEAVLARLSDYAAASIADFIDIHDDGSWKLNLKKAEERGRLHLLKRIGWNQRTGKPEIELHDSMAATVHLGRAYAMFTDKVKHEDWRSDAIEAIRDGKADYDSLLEAFNDAELVRDLFRMAGVEPVVKGGQS